MWFCYGGIASRTVLDNKMIINSKRFGDVQEESAAVLIKAVSFRAPVKLGVKCNAHGRQHLPPSVKLSLPTMCLIIKEITH